MTGAIFHTKRSDSACGSSGYISIDIKVNERTYTVYCGFNTPYSGTNHSGVKILLSDGYSDEKGKLLHGTDNTEVVTDIIALCNTKHDNRNGGRHVFYEKCRHFMVQVSFDNHF